MEKMSPQEWLDMKKRAGAFPLLRHPILAWKLGEGTWQIQAAFIVFWACLGILIGWIGWDIMLVW